MKRLPVTAIILTKNEANMLPGCLRTLGWCKEIILIDDGSTDETLTIAEQEGIRVVSFKHSSFARKREEGAKHAKSEWLLYIDADERVTPQLYLEIETVISQKQAAAFAFKRENVFFGQQMKHGGWETDSVTRLIKKNHLKGWDGIIHESPRLSVSAVLLEYPLIHFSHRTVRDGLQKSAEWTYKEAQLIARQTKEAVGAWVVVRKGLGELFRRLIRWQGYRDGAGGVMEALIQAINRMLVYIQVWELQQNPPIEELYAVKERELEILWERENSDEKEL